MSEQANDETSTLPAAATPGETSASSSLLTRHLQKFGPPDLEVVVGPKEYVYRYHSVILASQSLYVDTLLSSPAAKREQSDWRISFSEIEVSTWEKMMKYLGPCITNPSVEDALEIIPFYDKFQFHDGLKFCDTVIAKHLQMDEYVEDDQPLCRLVAMIYPLNFFPLSKPIAAEWAKRCLSKFKSVDEEMIRKLMPLVDNDEKVIKSMVSTYLGRKCKGMSMTEMRDLIKQPDFPNKAILRCKQIKEIDNQLSFLNVKELTIYHPESIKGSYAYRSSFDKTLGNPEYGSEFAVSHRGGAMRGYWIKVKYGQVLADERIIITSTDVFGSVWEIFQEPAMDEEGDDEASETESQVSERRAERRAWQEAERRILFRWESGMFGSLAPPMNGWEAIDDDGNRVVVKDIRMSYIYNDKSIW